MRLLSSKNRRDSKSPEKIPKDTASNVHNSFNRQEINTKDAVPLLNLALREIKGRDLTSPLLFLPFRLESSSVAISTFLHLFLNIQPCIRELEHELRLLTTLELLSLLRWTYSRLEGGLMSKIEYEAFCKYENISSPNESNRYRIILAGIFDSTHREEIFYGFMELLTILAAYGHHNGHTIMQLANLSAILVFPNDNGSRPDFKLTYSCWITSVIQTQHLFLGYLRAMMGEVQSGISAVPARLQALVLAEPYPPSPLTSKVLVKALKLKITARTMSNTPLALLKRALLHAHRIDSSTLDLLATSSENLGLSLESMRILEAIEAVNSERSERMPSDAHDARWLKFGDHGFQYEPQSPMHSGVRAPHDKRYTPNWSQFMLAGFDNARHLNSPQILPMHLHLPQVTGEDDFSDQTISMCPGVLTEVNTIRVDKTLWNAWVLSLAGEMSDRLKGTFGRIVIVQPCASEELVVIEEVLDCNLFGETTPHVVGKEHSRPSMLRTLSRRLRGSPPSKCKIRPSNDLSGVVEENVQRHSIDERLRIILEKPQSAAIPAPDCAPMPSTETVKLSRRSFINSLQLDCSDDIVAALAWTKSYDDDLRRSEANTEDEINANADVKPVDIVDTAFAVPLGSDTIPLYRPPHEKQPHIRVQANREVSSFEDDLQSISLSNGFDRNVCIRAIQKRCSGPVKGLAKTGILHRILSLHIKKSQYQYKRKVPKQPEPKAKRTKQAAESSSNPTDMTPLPPARPSRRIDTQRTAIPVTSQFSVTVSSLASSNASTEFLASPRRVPVVHEQGSHDGRRLNVMPSNNLAVIDEISKIEQKLAELKH